jgi:integrase
MAEISQKLSNLALKIGAVSVRVVWRKQRRGCELSRRRRSLVGATSPYLPKPSPCCRAHRVKLMELRVELGQGGQPGLVFGTIEGDLLSPDNLSRDWRRACRAHKLTLVSFHALRHTHASLLIAKGVDVLAVGRRLGHSRASTTLDKYRHLVEGADEAAAKA